MNMWKMHASIHFENFLFSRIICRRPYELFHSHLGDLCGYSEVLKGMYIWRLPPNKIGSEGKHAVATLVSRPCWLSFLLVSPELWV